MSKHPKQSLEYSKKQEQEEENPQRESRMRRKLADTISTAQSMDARIEYVARLNEWKKNWEQEQKNKKTGGNKNTKRKETKRNKSSKKTKTRKQR